MTRDPIRRRRFLGVTATAIGVGLAGCAGGSAYDNNDDGSNSDTGGSGGDGGDGGDGGSGGSGDSSDFGGWFENVGNFDGVVDKTGQSAVTIMVGAEGNGGGYAFDPAAIKVDTGTTVTWEWTGDGGSHNVVEEDGSFESELVGDAGHTFSHTFDTAGTFKYKCAPHEAMGMKGAVVVE